MAGSSLKRGFRITKRKTYAKDLFFTLGISSIIYFTYVISPDGIGKGSSLIKFFFIKIITENNYRKNEEENTIKRSKKTDFVLVH